MRRIIQANIDRFTLMLGTETDPAKRSNLSSPAGRARSQAPARAEGREDSVLSVGPKPPM